MTRAGTSRGTFKLQLPKMEKGDDMCKFIKRLEVVLTRNGVDRDAWLDCLVSQITQEASEAVIALLMEDDCAYEDVKNVLLSRSGYSLVTASENFFANLDTSKEVELGMRLEDVCEWSEKVMEGAGSIIEGAHMIGRATARQDLADSLKYGIDLRKPNCNSDFITCCMEWQARQPPNTSVFKRPSSRDRPAPYRVEEKGGLRCFKCGKQGHVSKQCWANPSREPDKTERSERFDKQKQTSKEAKQVKCFTCNRPGHKSADCLERKANYRRVETPEAEVTVLDENETMVSIDGVLIPMTVDTGAKVSLVQRELIPSECLSGRKQLYFGVGGRTG